VWDDLQTDVYEGMLAETVTITGHGGDPIHAYLSRPLGAGPYPGIVLIPHMPGWDELNREVARRYSQHGFAVVCPNIYQRFGEGAPAEIAGRAVKAGYVPDETVMGDVAGAMSFLRAQPYANGRVGVTGMCSGGRHAFLAGCTLEGVDAVVECWGGGVVQPAEQLSASQPVAPVDLTEHLSCPMIGIFGNDDQRPSPADVDQHEEALRKYGKDYAFYRYDGAAHAIWNYARDSYRPEAALDSWNKALAFFDKQLRS